jgi:hypothetical protein
MKQTVDNLKIQHIVFEWNQAACYRLKRIEKYEFYRLYLLYYRLLHFFLEGLSLFRAGKFKKGEGNKSCKEYTFECQHHCIKA